MVKYYIDCDEKYPWYYISKPTGNECNYYKDTTELVDISKDKLEWIERVEKEYEEVQKYLKKKGGFY